VSWPVIALLDYDSGNIRSVEKALRKAGAEVVRTRTPEALAGAQGIVLPGVGAFDDCIQAMERQGLLGAVRAWIAADRPFLGICVGYQALFERSEEFNSRASGLGIFQGPVVRFEPTQEMPHLKIPQIGWNQIHLRQPDCPRVVGSTSFTVSTPAPPTQFSWPLKPPMGQPLLRPFGAETRSPPSSIRKRARKMDSVCWPILWN